MNARKLCQWTSALALAFSTGLSAAPLFKEINGSLGDDVPKAARAAAVKLNQDALAQAREGDPLVIAIPGVGKYVYRVTRHVRNGEVDVIEAVLDGKHRAVLGARAEGVSGVIATPKGVYSLGYVNGEQWIGVAGAADRQRFAAEAPRPELFTQRVAARKEKAPVKGAQPVNVNLAELTELKPGEEALMNLSDLGPLRVRYEGTQAGTDSATWVGYLKDFGNDYRVLLTYSPTGVTGHILTPQGELSIESNAQGASYLIDPRKLGLTRVEGDASCQVATTALTADGAAAEATASTGAATTAPPTAAATAGATVVDVLVLYSAGFAADKGGTAQAQAAIDHLVALTNQAYVDSGVQMQIRKVGAEQLSVSDNTSNGSELSNLTNGTGVYSAIKARRDALGADMVTLIRPFRNQTHAGCGIAWVGGYNGSPIANSSSYAYSVVSEGRDRAGSGWYCDVTTFAHELGHNQGLMHDRATVARQGGGQGATPYAYGYGIGGSFGTVMSYIWPKVGKFSNPNNFTCGGAQRCGVPVADAANSADNAQALNFTRTGVAAFRNASTNPPPTGGKLTISGLVRFNGQPSVNTLVRGDNGALCTRTGSNGVYRCTVNAGYTGTIKPYKWVPNRWAKFTPPSRSYTDLRTNLANQNYSGVP